MSILPGIDQIRNDNFGIYPNLPAIIKEEGQFKQSDMGENMQQDQAVNSRARDEFYLSVAFFGLFAISLISLVPPA